MKIPHKKKERINKIQHLMTSDLVLLKTKKYIFYKIILDLLDWVLDEIKKYDLEKDEIKSEVFILSCRLYNNFDETKSSLIPFLEQHIDWELARLFKKLKKETILQEQVPKKYTNSLPEEVYIKLPESLFFEDRFLGKVFTTSEKYVIQEILSEEHINYLNLSEKSGIDRRTIKDKVDSIKNKLEELIYD